MVDQTWCKLYHAFMDHPKVLKAGPNAAYLWVVSIAWASRNLTDGFIPSQQVKRLVDWDDIIEVRRTPPRKGMHSFVEASRLAARLVDAGLWEKAEDGYQIHDFLHWQRSAEQWEALRQRRSSAGKQGGRASAAARQSKQVLEQNASKRQAKRKQTSSKIQADVDVDVEVKDLTSSVDDSKNADPEVVRLCQLLADLIVKRDPKAAPKPNSAGWLRDMRLLVHSDRGGDVAEVERVIHWAQADSFWQSNVLSPAKLRKQFSRLVIQSQARAQDSSQERAERRARRSAALQELQTNGPRPQEAEYDLD